MSSKTTSQPGSIELIGGHVALDLVNTVSWRHDGNRRRENLAVPVDLLTWATRATVIDEQDTAALRSAMAEDVKAADRALRRVRRLREQLYRHLAYCIEHRGVQRRIAWAFPLQRTFADAIAASSLAGTPARWILEASTPLNLARMLALQALDLVQTMPGERLRCCEDEGCGWLFLDTTRNHSRRWCSSADCGNRDRARRHYARTRTNRQSTAETVDPRARRRDD